MREFVFEVNGDRIIRLLDRKIPRVAGNAGSAGVPLVLPEGLQDGFREGRREGIGKNDNSLILSEI